MTKMARFRFCLVHFLLLQLFWTFGTLAHVQDSIATTTVATSGAGSDTTTSASKSSISLSSVDGPVSHRNTEQILMLANTVSKQTATAPNSAQTNAQLTQSSSSNSGSNQASASASGGSDAGQSNSMMPKPGQFTMVSNREVSPGHVTMIGYTTPIVKVGEPIPLEQYLKQHRQQMELNSLSHQKPTSSYSPMQYSPKFANLIEADPSQQDSGHFVPIPPPSNYRKSSSSEPRQMQATLSNTPDSATAAAVPIKQYTNSKYSQLMLNGNNAPLYTEQPREQAFTNVQSPSHHQYQQQLQQSQPQSQNQFSVPLEKPRPFVVYKPGFAPKYQQLPQELPPPSPKPTVAYQTVNGYGQQSALNNVFPLAEVTSNELRPQDMYRSTSNFANLEPVLRQTVSQSLLQKQLPQQSAYSQYSQERTPFQQYSGESVPANVGYNPIYFTRPSSSVSPNFRQALSAEKPGQLYGKPLYEEAGKSLRMVASPSPVGLFAQQQHSQAAPINQKIDPKAELQNQISLVLTNSPNLSEDTRQKHRQSIMQAVQASLESDHNPNSISDKISPSQRPFGSAALYRESAYDRERNAKMMMQLAAPPKDLYQKENNQMMNHHMQRPQSEAMNAKYSSVFTDQAQLVKAPTSGQSIDPQTFSHPHLLPPLNYKHKMQQQIQRYLQEQIEKEANSPMPMSNYLATVLNSQPGGMAANTGARLQMSPGQMLLSSPEEHSGQSSVGQSRQSQMAPQKAEVNRYVLSSPAQYYEGEKQSAQNVHNTNHYRTASETRSNGDSGANNGISTAASSTESTKMSSVQPQQSTSANQMSAPLQTPTSAYTGLIQQKMIPFVSNVQPSEGRSMRELSEWWKETALAQRPSLMIYRRIFE